MSAMDERQAATRLVLWELDRHLAAQSQPDPSDGGEPATDGAGRWQDRRHLIGGTSLVLIGGERRVEQERTLTERFRRWHLTWYRLTDNPTMESWE